MNVAPDDPRLHFDGFVHASLSTDRARLDRSPFGRDESVSRLSNPGVHISFVTDAHRVQAIFDYHGQGKPCHPDCPRLADGTTCYRPHSATCPNQCELLVEIDGVRTKVPHTNLVGQTITHEHKQRDFLGEVKLTLMDHDGTDHGHGTGKASAHRYRLTLPWGSPVDLKRIHVEHPPEVEAMPQLLDLPLRTLGAGAPRWVAYGDAATLGWCAQEGYPTLLAERNGWIALNLGLAGAQVQPEYGEAIGRLGGDLITISVGAGEWDACRNADVTAAYTELLSGVRRVQPTVPIVAITPTLSWREGIPCSGAAAIVPDATRAQIEAAVTARQRSGDSNVYLVRGKPLVPDRYLADGLHPSDVGMRELASHLNAEMGFGHVQYKVTKCPTLTIEVTGIGPDGWFEVYWGAAPTDGKAHVLGAEAAASGVQPAGGAPVNGGAPVKSCAGHSLLLSPHGKMTASADSRGRATIVVPQVSGFDSCHTTLFQIIEVAGCTVSRLGHVTTTFDSRKGTPAERWTKWLPPSPSPPPPHPRRQSATNPPPAANEAAHGAPTTGLLQPSVPLPPPPPPRPPHQAHSGGDEPLGGDRHGNNGGDGHSGSGHHAVGAGASSSSLPSSSSPQHAASPSAILHRVPVDVDAAAAGAVAAGATPSKTSPSPAAAAASSTATSAPSSSTGAPGALATQPFSFAQHPLAKLVRMACLVGLIGLSALLLCVLGLRCLRVLCCRGSRRRSGNGPPRRRRGRGGGGRMRQDEYDEDEEDEELEEDDRFHSRQRSHAGGRSGARGGLRSSGGRPVLSAADEELLASEFGIAARAEADEMDDLPNMDNLPLGSEACSVASRTAMLERRAATGSSSCEVDAMGDRKDGAVDRRAAQIGRSAASHVWQASLSAAAARSTSSGGGGAGRTCSLVAAAAACGGRRGGGGGSSCCGAGRPCNGGGGDLPTNRETSEPADAHRPKTPLEQDDLQLIDLLATQRQKIEEAMRGIVPLQSPLPGPVAPAPSLTASTLPRPPPPRPPPPPAPPPPPTVTPGGGGSSGRAGGGAIGLFDSPEFLSKLERRKSQLEAMQPVVPPHGGGEQGQCHDDGGMSYLEELASRIAARQQGGDGR